MPTSIFEIDVNDSKFKAFQANFQKYHDMLGKMPGAWGKVDKATEEVSDNFTKMTAAMLAQAELLQRQEKSETALARTSANTGRSMKGLVRDSADVAKNIGAATVSLLKWAGITSILGGLLGAGGLWGIERLATGAGASRRNAAGLGVSSGEQQAFGINFGRFVDPNSTLGNVAAVKSDYSRRWAFGAMGINDIDKKNPAEIAAEAIMKAKSIFDRGDQSEQSAKANGLLEIFTMDELRRLHNTPQAEIDKQQQTFNRDKTTLAVDPNIQRAWQDFNAQLDRAGTKIDNVLIKGLVPLAKPLEELSDAFADALKTLLESGAAKDAIKWLAVEVKEFAKYLASPKFKQDLKDLEIGLEHFLTALGNIVRWVSDHFGGSKPGPGEPGGAPPANLWAGFGADDSWGDKKILQNGVMAASGFNVPWINNPVTGASPVLANDSLPSTSSKQSEAGGWTRLTQSFTSAMGRVGFHQSGVDVTGAPMNNPGNLASWKNTPMGEVRMNDGSTRKFAKFDTLDQGIQALGDQMQLYFHRDHLDTIDAVVNKYAPANENDTAAYIKRMESMTGFKHDEHLNLDEAGTLSKIVSGLIRNENRGWNDLTPDRVFIQISNNTGGSAVVTTSQVAAQ